MSTKKEIQDIANILRSDVLRMTSQAKSGHPTSALSCAEIISSLFFHEMVFDIKDANNPNNDEFILSKGHAASILYAALFRAGCINQNILDYRKISSPLEGHPVPHESLKGWIKVASGSLGQGLSIATGIALASKLQNKKYRTYVLLGDSEIAEGSVWEAFQIASYYKLNSLIAIIDINRLGQRGETMLGHNISLYSSRLSSFGWDVITIDGHNISQILSALQKARKSNKPTAILAKTFKGFPVSFLKDKQGWHGKSLSPDELKKALKELPSPQIPQIRIKSPLNIKSKKYDLLPLNLNIPAPTNYFLGDNIATREAYGKALAKLAKTNKSVLALDAEVSNSTFAELVKKKTFKQFIECFIAEQNMIGMAIGLSIKGFNTFSSSFASFLTRSHDQLRMAAISNANFTVCGSHSGVSIGEDGASQMGLEDIGMFRSLPNSIIFYPSDAVSTEKLVFLSSQLPDIKYIRTTRPKTSVIYSPQESFTLGNFKILKSSNEDKVVLIGAGITTHESLKAYDELKKQKISVSVIDLYCIKPFNTQKLIHFIKSHGSRAVIAEDHYAEGGIGEMLSSALINTNIKFSHLCIKEIPHSGNMEELLDKYGISSKHIASIAKEIIT